MLALLSTEHSRLFCEYAQLPNRKWLSYSLASIMYAILPLYHFSITTASIPTPMSCDKHFPYYTTTRDSGSRNYIYELSSLLKNQQSSRNHWSLHQFRQITITSVNYRRVDSKRYSPCVLPPQLFFQASSCSLHNPKHSSRISAKPVTHQV